MRYCAKCVMPDTRPGSIFDEAGVCQACLNYDKRQTVDWEKRFEELKALCKRYKRTDGYYDPDSTKPERTDQVVERSQ